MKNHRVDYSIGGMCTGFGVSRSGYYAWLHRKPSQRHQNRQHLDNRVKVLFDRHKQRYGAKRLQREIGHEDVTRHNLKTVAASLQRQGLVAKAARKFKATTNSKHNLPVFGNLLEQDFNAAAPNLKWVGDITYLWTDERPKGVTVHSGRGSQYCSHSYRQLLGKHQMLGSMNARGNCYGNACAGSFFHSLKVGATHGERFATREAMRQTVFGYIETDYNRVRLHSANSYRSPIGFEADFYQHPAS